MLRILVVEDEANVRRAVVQALAAAEHVVTEAADGAIAIERLTSTTFDVVVTDFRLPRADGLAVFRHAKKTSPTTSVIMMTSFGSVSNAVDAMKEGVTDYLTKPFDPDELILRVGRIADKIRLERELEAARAVLSASGEVEIVGTSPPMIRLLERVEQVAKSDAAVLVSGESGTGKELVARRIHARSGRAAGAFVAINCAAFPDTLLEAELFGYERGAFTGAVKKRDGRFKAADKGTLFLDEVGEMPMPAQAKLLRVLQEGIVEPLGTNQSIKVDVRIVSATNRDLKKAIAEGRFREDLFYRLHVIGLHIPPLRERPGDLPVLLSHFFAKRGGGASPNVSVRAWQALTAYPFPGNVRELAHAVEHAAVLSRSDGIDLEDLPDDIVKAVSAKTPGGATLAPLASVLKQAEREHLLKALAVAGGKRGRAADLLGISRKNLWEKLRAHAIADSDLDDDISEK
ncbi:MAG: sigma-54 dependent transcriptional regulator [Polyangiaceae bacterium]